MELAWRTRPDDGSKTERRYLDFIVDGESLQDLLHADDQVTRIGCWDSGFERDFLVQLLLQAPPESPSGRVPIYVCGECGDLGCGAVTAKVELTPEGYVWKDFGHENDYAPDMSDFVSYREVGPFLFDRERYWRLFSERLGPL